MYGVYILNLHIQLKPIIMPVMIVIYCFMPILISNISHKTTFPIKPPALRHGNFCRLNYLAFLLMLINNVYPVYIFLRLKH